MKKFLLRLCFAFALGSWTFADVSCPQCGHPNAEEDRYCEECASELRPWKPEDHKEIPKPVPLPEPVRPPSNRQKTAEPQPAHDPVQLYVQGKKVELGDRKAVLKRRLDNYSGGNTWFFDSGHQQVTLYFDDAVLTEWRRHQEIREDWDLDKDLSSDVKRLQNGMSDEEVLKLLGNAHVQEETCSFSQHSLKWIYYLKPERLMKKWTSSMGVYQKTQTDLPDDSPMITITFDDTLHVTDVQEGIETLR